MAIGGSRNGYHVLLQGIPRKTWLLYVVFPFRQRNKRRLLSGDDTTTHARRRCRPDQPSDLAFSFEIKALPRLAPFFRD